MSEVAAFIKRTAERTKFTRESFIERNVPNVASNVMAIPFYGNLGSTLTLSSLILRNYKELHKDKYIILCSWPGYRGLFPYVDEYWSIDDDSVTSRLAAEANNFYNESSLATEISRSLIECLDTVSSRDFEGFFDRGITGKYRDTFGELRRYLPEVPSETFIADGFRQQLARKSGRKIIIYPSKKMWSWQKGRGVELPVSPEFWIALCDRLLDEGYTPVVWQNWFTYDLSKHFVDRCIYLVPSNITDVLAAMRHIGLVLDVHSDVSKVAMAARTPFIAVDERQLFAEYKRYMWDDICGKDVPRQYIFSFSTMLMSGSADDWKISVIDNIIKRLESFEPVLDVSTTESYETVDYENIRKWKAKRMGVHFIRSAKNK